VAATAQKLQHGILSYHLDNHQWRKTTETELKLSSTFDPKPTAAAAVFCRCRQVSVFIDTNLLYLVPVLLVAYSRLTPKSD